jgi:hydrogenase-4 component B
MFEFLFSIGLVSLFLGVILPLLGLKNSGSKLPRQASFLLVCVGGISLLVFASEILLSGASFSILAYQIVPSFQFSFFVDRLSAFFIILISVVSVAVSIYSVQYVEHMEHDVRKNLVAAFMSLFIFSMVLVIGSETMFSFLFFWETMALSSFLLVMMEYEKKETAKAGLFYFIMTHLSTLFLIFAFLFIYNATGTFNIQPIKADPIISSVAFVFLFLAFAIKAGVVPFHKWLPYAHPASPSNISALMSGVMLKVAIYGLIRFVLLLPMEMWWGLLILVAGSASAILGVIYAMKEYDLKKMLAYSSIENIGIILIGFGLYIVFSISGLQTIAMLALVGALFHSLNHALFKSLLFMTAGSVVNSTGTRNIDEMGGLIKNMPYTALFFVVGAVSISALPPFNGFVSELMIFQAFFQSVALGNPFLELMIIISLSIFALTSALAAACFVKAYGITFLALPRTDKAGGAKESPKLMLVGPAICALLCVVLGVFSFQIFAVLGFSFPLPDMVLVGSGLAVFYVLVWALLRSNAAKKARITETWGCGLPSQNSKMEYSDSGFSEPIVTIFKSIYRTKKKSEREYFDDKKSIFKSGKAEIQLMNFFEEYIYFPIARFTKRISGKVSDVQRGDLHLLMGYAFATIVVILLLIWWFA